jgi:PAS domain S-box-containing protein
MADVDGKPGGLGLSALDQEVAVASLEALALGVTVWRFADPSEAASLVLAGANGAALQLLGLEDPTATVSAAELFRDTGVDVGARCMAVLTTQRRQHLGELRLGDSQSPDALLVGDAFPLPGGAIGVTLEDVSSRIWIDSTFEQSEDLWRKMLDNAPGYLWATDLEGRIMLANRAPPGLTPELLVGRSVFDFTPDDAEALLRRSIQRTIDTRQTTGFESRGVATGTWYRLEIGPMTRGGDVIGLVMNTTDVTDRKHAELELAAKAEALERSNAELEQFAYVASHDLQEPLRMVAGFTKLLKKEYGGQLGPEADGYIDFAVDGARRMQRLISDLLEFARVGSRGRSFHPVDLGEIVQDVLRDLQLALADARAEIELGSLPTVVGDRRQLSQLLLNLLTNALKFREPGEPARVEITAEVHSDRTVVAVRDRGIGIDPRYVSRIFGVFQRLHARDEFPGTGIGLAICKKIVERHGGTIWVDSAPGEGATFYFSIVRPAAP